MYLIIFIAFAIYGYDCQEVTIWSEWMEWSACSKLNGYDVMKRIRLCAINSCSGNSVEVKDCYSDKICKESAFINHTIELTQYSELATLKNLYKDFVLSFEFLSPSTELTGNIIQLLDSDYNDCCALSRYFDGKLTLYSGIDFFTTEDSVKVNTWHSVQIQQNYINGNYNNTIAINRTVVFSAVNNEPQDVSNIAMYACLDPCSLQRLGAIRNINIVSESKGSWYDWSPWSACDSNGRSKRSRRCDNVCAGCVGNDTETTACHS